MDIEFIGFVDRWDKYEGLFRELLAYQRRSICLYLNGRRSTAYEITHACMAAEEGGYMRDYLGDDAGRLIQISFDRVRE